MVYVISYDLNKEGQNYEGLYKAIKECGAWWHYLDSTWLIGTSRNARQIYDVLKDKIDKNDTLLIMKAADDYAGWLSEDASAWINDANFN